MKISQLIQPQPETSSLFGWNFEGEYFPDDEQLRSYIFDNMQYVPLGAVYADGTKDVLFVDGEKCTVEDVEVEHFPDGWEVDCHRG